MNLHNAEVREFFFPEEGNAYYNAIDYDPSPAVGAPTAAPAYYALLLFARFAQGTRGLRPVAVARTRPRARRCGPGGLTRASRRRLFVAEHGGPSADDGALTRPGRATSWTA